MTATTAAHGATIFIIQSYSPGGDNMHSSLAH